MRSRRRNVIAMLNETPPETFPQSSNALAERETPMSVKPLLAKEQKKAKRKGRRTVREIEVFEDKPRIVKYLRKHLFRPKILVTLATILAAVTIIPRISSWFPDPAERQEYLLDSEKISITEPPRYVPVDLVDQVIRHAKLPEKLSLLDNDLTTRVAKAFESHPWVLGVVKVTKTFPASVEVELKYREPVAMVVVVDGMYPIDEQSVLLPPVDFSVADTRRFPVILGVPAPPQGAEGTRWGDASVVGAARLAKMLSPHWKRLNLKAIKISPRKQAVVSADNITYELVTRGGSRILWGRGPHSRHPGELTPDQKIGRMQKYMADFGGFDHPHGPYEIDIRHWQEISRRPLTASRSTTTRR